MTHRECRGCQQFTFSQNVEDVWKLFEKLVNGPCSHCRGRKASDSPGGFWSRQWSWPFSKIESARYPRITRAKTFRKTAQLSATIRQQFVVFLKDMFPMQWSHPLQIPYPFLIQRWQLRQGDSPNGSPEQKLQSDARNSEGKEDGTNV